MNIKLAGRLIGALLALEALFMLPSLGLALADRERPVIISFLVTMGLLLSLGVLLRVICRNNAPEPSYTREGMVTVALSWIVMSVLGCLPFRLSGAIPRFIDALFEMVSGFTTTGASILTDVEGLGRALL